VNYQGNSAASRDVAYHLHPYTNFRVLERDGPLIITRGEGVHVYDDAGNKYIEGLAGLWCTSLGFSEQRLIDAATKQLNNLPFYHNFAGRVSDTVIELAAKLVEMAPVPMSKVFFANSGSEATDTAVKLIWYYNNARGRPEKKKIISRMKGYHGVTVAAASMTGLPNNHLDFDLPIQNIMHTVCPHYYRYGEDGESEEDFATRCADSLEQMILEEGPDTVAAFIAEPVMGAGGVIVPPATYFEKIQAVVRKYDMLFVVDEVICGFGRTGNMFGSQTFDLKPDMMTMAKALTSAYLPMSALMISEDVYAAMQTANDKIGIFAHGFTYSGHPVPAAVALETLKIYEERDIVGHVQSVMGRFQDGLRQFSDHALVGEVRGIGLIGALEFVKDKATKEPFSAEEGVATKVMDRALDHGLITRAIGDSIAFSPPLIITTEQVDDLVARLGRTLDDVAQAMA